MILIEKAQLVGLEATIRGMRNPMNSWAKSDSFCNKPCRKCPDHQKCDFYFAGVGEDKAKRYRKNGYIGPNDLDLMMRLAKAGSVDGKFRRMMVVYVDLTAPLYWWKEFDTYKVGTVANSCSTMHKIHAKEFTLDDFSREHLTKRSMRRLLVTIEELNFWRDIFLNGGEVDNEDGTSRVFEPKDKDAWWQMIQLLPSSYNQKRTIMLNYEVLANIYKHRRNHKLDEWRELCHWIESLPYSEIITCNTWKPCFTCEELREKFIKTHPFVEISHYKPYPCDNGIIVWVSKLNNMPLTIPREIAFCYDPEKDIFAPIPDAKSYEEIMVGEKRNKS